MALPEPLRTLCKHPGMYMGQSSYHGVTAAITGFDLACHGGLLNGFQEWLALRLDGFNNIGWPGLVLQITFGDEWAAVETPEGQRKAIDRLVCLFDEFHSAVLREGLASIYVKHTNWVSRQSWAAAMKKPQVDRAE